MGEWPIEWVGVTEITEHPHNPRFHPERQQEALASSLGEFGDISVLIWNRRTGHLVDGEARFRLGKTRGETSFQCRVVDWDEETEHRALLTFDKIGSLATLAEEKFHALLSALETPLAEDTFLSQVWEEGEYPVQVQEEDPFSVSVEEEDEEETEVEDIPTRTRVGEVWDLGGHRLLVGDCTEAPLVARLFHGQRASITVTSPPYNVDSIPAWNKKKKEFKMEVKKYLKEEEDTQPQAGYLALLEDFTDLALSHSDYLFVNIQMLAGNKRELILYLQKHLTQIADCIIWDKASAEPAMAHNVMNSQFEFIWVLDHKEGDGLRRIRTASFHGTVSNVFTWGKQRNNPYAGIHAATYPLELPLHLIENFSPPKSIIYDPFLGTGTTLIACEQLDRTCYGCELEPRYADIILARWESVTGEKAWCLE